MVHGALGGVDAELIAGLTFLFDLVPQPADPMGDAAGEPNGVGEVPDDQQEVDME